MSATDDLPSAAALGLTRLVHLTETDSTMDAVHRLAEQGAPAGTLVVADRQVRGRGRAGKVWASEQGGGLWMTLLERPTNPAASGVLALRIGMAVADAVEPFVDGDVRLKWPNDLFVAEKLAGILVEARWRDAAIDWVAVGVGVNMRLPAGNVAASCVRAGVARSTLVTALVVAMRAAARCTGVLTATELRRWQQRDLARGRRIVSPVPGIACGISCEGALLVQGADGQPALSVSSGSLVFTDHSDVAAGTPGLNPEYRSAIRSTSAAI